MSKIEDALEKAKKSRESGSAQLTVVGNNQVVTDTKSKGLDKIPGQENDAIQRVSYSKEIMLMDDGKIRDNKELSELKIIYSEMNDTKVANTFRDLRTKLIHASKGKNFIAMITSCYSGENSSSVTINLATAFSFDESKTSLIIDCNLSNPTIDKMLGLDANIGLTDYLENEDTKVDDTLCKTGIKRMKVIPAGTSIENTVEYFTSARIRNMMQEILNRYSDRYVFLEAAPITESADSRILMDLCDYVILTVPYGRVTKRKVQDAAEAIGDKLLGVVFNEVPKPPRFKIPGTGRSNT